MIQLPKFDYSAFGSYTPSGSRRNPEVTSLSGGRSSAYLQIALQNGGFGKSSDVVSFQNTGVEHESCYAFLNDLQQYLTTPITWLEYCNTDIFNELLRPDFSYDRFYDCGYTHIFQIVDAVRIRKFIYSKSKNNFWYKEGFQNPMESFKIVDYKSASRNGSPFTDIFLYKCILRLMQRKELILPNAAQRWCTNDTKIRVYDRYLQSLGIHDRIHYFGMRYDEQDRVDKLFRLNDNNKGIEHDCPLYWNQVTKADVSNAWNKQPIDLGLNLGINTFRDFIGNCVYCHLKAKIKKLYLMQHGFSFSLFRQCETIVNNYNHTPSAMSNQAGTYEALYDIAMHMDEIPIEAVLSDSEKEIHCFGCGE